MVKEQKVVYEKFLQQLLDPVLILEPRKIIFSNDAARTIASTPDQLYQKVSSVVSVGTGETLEDVIRKRLSKSEISSEPIKQENFRYLDNHGSKTLVVTLIESSFLYRQKTVAIVLRDITAELMREEKRVEEKYKNMVLFSLSHELRTPLNILQSALALAKRIPHMSAEERITYCSGKGAWHCLRNKINDALTYAQFLTGEFVLHEESFSLPRFVAYLSKMTTFLLQKKTMKVKLRFSVADEVESPFVADKERLEQVLFNLLQNAVRYTDKGSIGLNVEVREGNTVFEVSDTGCGVPDDIRAHIFRSRSGAESPKLWSHSPLKCPSLSKACGLGLTVSGMVCRKMGGDLSVDSLPSRGSTFSFYIPIRKVRTQLLPQNFGSEYNIPEEDCKVNVCTGYDFGSFGLKLSTVGNGCGSHNRAASTSCHVPAVAEGKGLSVGIRLDNAGLGLSRKVGSDADIGLTIVIVVDDNDFNRLVARRMVECCCDYRVVEAENGEIALAKLREWAESGRVARVLILMDLDMPVMNGLDATKAIRRFVPEPRPYICALTAFASETERISCMRAGMDWFLSKPLTKQNLLAVFGRFVV